MTRWQIFQGDARMVAKRLEPRSLDMVATSPPYFGLRSYLQAGHADKDNEVGLESMPEEYVRAIVETFRVLMLDGRPADLRAMRSTSKESPRPAQGMGHHRIVTIRQHMGWRPSCACGAGVRPAVVLDPFCGTGRTGLAAARLGRDFIGIDLNPSTARLARRLVRRAYEEMDPGWPALTVEPALGPLFQEVSP